MEDFSKRYLCRPVDMYQELKELDTVLWEFETADIRAHSVDVSLEFWKKLQLCKHIYLKPNGDVFYKYLKVNVNPKQDVDFRLY